MLMSIPTTNVPRVRVICLDIRRLSHCSLEGEGEKVR